MPESIPEIRARGLRVEEWLVGGLLMYRWAIYDPMNDVLASRSKECYDTRDAALEEGRRWFARSLGGV